MSATERRLAVFDLNDTLVDNLGAVDLWFAELVEQRALGPQGMAFLQAEQERPVSPDESFRSIVEHFGFTETAAELQQIMANRIPQLARVFDGVEAGLTQLREAGWRTALLTNGLASEQHTKVEMGLHKYFDVLVFADEEAVRKPDPAVYRLTAKRSGIAPEHTWMVGDSIKWDLAGAAEAGMSTVWVCGGRALPVEGVRPSLVVDAVAEVFPFLLGEPLR